VQSILGLPGSLLKMVLRIILGVRGKGAENGVAVNKGKGSKGAKSPVRKRS
jgi:hypothetical protein